MRPIVLATSVFFASSLLLQAGDLSRTLYDFSDADAGASWRAVNDGVMGGLSKGQFEVTSDDTLRFYGTLSLENNGGFASVRCNRENLDLSASGTIVVRVRGDGRSYNFNLYVPTQRTAFSYQAGFETEKDKWIEVEIPLARFRPTWFGRTLAEPRLDPGKVDGLGILLADKQPGEFELQVDSIRVRQTGDEAIVSAVACQGSYEKHLQGVARDLDAIYWSFTTTLVKTDRSGKVLDQRPVANHHGDLCFHEGKLFVAVNLGKFNDPAGNADSWVYVYDAATLEEVARHEVQEVYHGAGGIDVREGQFFVVGGLPDGVEENYVYQYDDQFRFVRRHVIASGHTHRGIQTAAFAHDRWWLGCYGDPRMLLVTDPDFRLLGKYEFDCSLGIAGLPDQRLLVATGTCKPEAGCQGVVHVAAPDEQSGLRRNE